MNALNLYSQIEQYLDFKEEVAELYEAYCDICDELEIKTLIDIGCGQGDFLLLLQAQNIQTYGTDLSSEQIKVCKRKGLDVACVDIASITTKYQAATAIFDVLNYLPKDNLKQFLENTYNLLEEGGYFIFDINTLYGFEEVAQGSLNINLKDKFIAIDADFNDKILKTNIALFEKYQQDDLYTKKEDFIVQHYHDKITLKKMLIQLGFDIKQIINFHLHSQKKADKLIFIIKKG